MQHVTNEYLKKFKLKFDCSNPNWYMLEKFNGTYLEHQYIWLNTNMVYFNDLIQVKPLRTMNRVEDGFDMVFEKGDKLEWKAMKQPDGSLLITFNLFNN